MSAGGRDRACLLAVKHMPTRHERKRSAFTRTHSFQVGFSYPVVPKGKARIRVQISAAHEREHLDAAIAAFTEVGRELGVIQ